MGEMSPGLGAGRLMDCGAAMAGCDRSPAVVGGFSNGSSDTGSFVSALTGFCGISKSPGFCLWKVSNTGGVECLMTDCRLRCAWLSSPFPFSFCHSSIPLGIGGTRGISPSFSCWISENALLAGEGRIPRRSGGDVRVRGGVKCRVC